MANSHHLSNLRLAAGTLLLAVAWPMAASAAFNVNTWDFISRSIPASACTPRDAASAQRVEMVSGGWRFIGNQVGRVVLTCPLPITYFPADKAQNVPPTALYVYRVWYRDSDGPANQASVRATPYRRNLLGSWTNIGLAGGGGGIFAPPGVCEFNSNLYPEVLFVVHEKECQHKVEMNALYAYEVVLTREVGSQQVEFHGIDFWSATYGGPEG